MSDNPMFPEALTVLVRDFNVETDVRRTKELGTSQEFGELVPRMKSVHRRILYCLNILEAQEDIDAHSKQLMSAHLNRFREVLDTIKMFGGQNSPNRNQILVRVNSQLDVMEKGDNSILPLHALMSSVQVYEDKRDDYERMSNEANRILLDLIKTEKEASQVSRRMQNYSARTVSGGYQKIFEKERHKYGLLSLVDDKSIPRFRRIKVGAAMLWLAVAAIIAFMIYKFIVVFFDGNYLVQLGDLFSKGKLPTSTEGNTTTEIPKESRTTVFVILSLTRLALLSFLTYLLATVFRQYNVSMHRSSSNAAKSNALASFDVFMDTVKDEPAEVRLPILMEVCKSIYSKETTGYIESEKSTPQNMLFDIKSYLDKQGQ